METYVMVLLGLVAIDTLGKVALLWKRETYRPLGCTAIDIVANVHLLAWGIWAVVRGAA